MTMMVCPWLKRYFNISLASNSGTRETAQFTVSQEIISGDCMNTAGTSEVHHRRRIVHLIRVRSNACQRSASNHSVLRVRIGISIRLYYHPSIYVCPRVWQRNILGHPLVDSIALVVCDGSGSSGQQRRWRFEGQVGHEGLLSGYCS